MIFHEDGSFEPLYRNMGKINYGIITRCKEKIGDQGLEKTICIRLKNTIEPDDKTVKNVYFLSDSDHWFIDVKDEISISNDFDILIGQGCVFGLAKEQDKLKVVSLEYVSEQPK